MQCCSCWSQQSEAMWLQKPLWRRQGAASPWCTGEAAAEQPGVCAKQLPQIKPDNWSCGEASVALLYALRPGSHAEIHAMKQSRVYFSCMEIKRILTHFWSLACAPALLCTGGTWSLCCPAAGRCISISQQLADSSNQVKGSYCCILAVFRRECIPSECVEATALEQQLP